MAWKSVLTLGVPVLIGTLILATAGTAQAQRPGWGHFGGARFGGNRARFYHGGYHFSPYYGHGYGFHSPGYGYRFGYYPYYPVYPYGYGYYPYYGYEYGSYSGYLAYGADDSRSPGQYQAYSPGVAAANLTAVNPLSGGSAAASPGGQAGTSAHFTVTVPAGADLWVNGTNTYSAGPVREFRSAPLTPGQQSTYEFRARWKGDDGREVTQTRQVAVTAGGYARVAFPVLSGAAAPPSGTSQR